MQIHAITRKNSGRDNITYMQSALGLGFVSAHCTLTSNAIVALSVSISATESPAAKASPSLTFHSAMVPASMVGDRAGMGTTM